MHLGMYEAIWGPIKKSSVVNRATASDDAFPPPPDLK
jgi:hypothetical protein